MGQGNRGRFAFVFAGVGGKNYFYFCSVNYPFPIFPCLVWSGFFTLECFTFGNRLSVCCRS